MSAKPIPHPYPTPSPSPPYGRYPHFNPQEMLEVAAMHEQLLKTAAAGEPPVPIITFNAELDRIRTGGD